MVMGDGDASFRSFIFIFALLAALYIHELGFTAN
jgi:hypothetical protein